MNSKKTIAVLFIAIFLMLLNLPFVHAEDGESKVNVSWKEKTHDFGDVKLNNPAKVTFEFTNDGEAPVILTTVKASCGCTTTNYTKTPVKPGEKGTIDVTYNSKRVGNFNKSVRVQFAGSESQLSLYVKGKVVE